MSLSKNATLLLNETIKVAKGVIPLDVKAGKPFLMQAPVWQNHYGVIIGVLGDLKGRLIIESTEDVIKQVAERMFGMPVEGEMLASFFGELGNMIGGNLCTSIYNEGVKLDITPPTVMVGQVSLHGFKTALRLPLLIEGEEKMYITLAIE